jgi:hypothetical protein
MGQRMLDELAALVTDGELKAIGSSGSANTVSAPVNKFNAGAAKTSTGTGFPRLDQPE